MAIYADLGQLLQEALDPKQVRAKGERRKQLKENIDYPPTKKKAGRTRLNEASDTFGQTFVLDGEEIGPLVDPQKFLYVVNFIADSIKDQLGITPEVDYDDFCEEATFFCPTEEENIYFTLYLDDSEEPVAWDFSSDSGYGGTLAYTEGEDEFDLDEFRKEAASEAIELIKEISFDDDWEEEDNSVDLTSLDDEELRADVARGNRNQGWGLSDEYIAGLDRDGMMGEIMKHAVIG